MQRFLRDGAINGEGTILLGTYDFVTRKFFVDRFGKWPRQLRVLAIRSVKIQ